MKKGLMASSLIGLSALLAACSSATAAPFEIKWGETECEVCKMKVVDRQFAAEAVMDNEKGYAFDDIGCLMKDWYPEQDKEEIAAMYVKDFKTKKWVELKDGTFVYDEGAKTPMVYNVVSFAKEADADRYIEMNGGEKMSFNQLKKHDWVRNEEMMKEKMKKHKMNSEMKENDAEKMHAH
ncbi:nitrous oxide reductase accessory protein NosL [Exiguobacterium flavidum]|uniref:nitrous oxide reductase accessory protein NosL n=1 Tax=Exiguobacterium flavidum TaxID=2184695 RepID=UPI000DF780E4|nr:nitrous oxide reductase accessory protein NosL [Exiguobacterium flavidum]